MWFGHIFVVSWRVVLGSFSRSYSTLINVTNMKNLRYIYQPGHFKKVVYLQDEIERYGGKILIMVNCKKTILVRKWLQIIFSKRFLALKTTFLRFCQNKKIATHKVKLSTTFVLTILFSDNFFCGLEGEEINFLQRFRNAIYTHIETFFIKHYEVLFFPAYT